MQVLQTNVRSRKALGNGCKRNDQGKTVLRNSMPKRLMPSYTSEPSLVACGGRRKSNQIAALPSVPDRCCVTSDHSRAKGRSCHCCSSHNYGSIGNLARRSDAQTKLVFEILLFQALLADTPQSGTECRYAQTKFLHQSESQPGKTYLSFVRCIIHNRPTESAEHYSDLSPILPITPAGNFV